MFVVKNVWSTFIHYFQVFCLGVTAQDDPHPSPASLYSEPEPHPSTSPLAQLLASATGSRSLVFPAISGQRNKRQPFQFKQKGRSKFTPKSFRKKTQETDYEKNKS